MNFITIKSNELLIDGTLYGGKAKRTTARAVTDAIRAGVADAASFAAHVLGNAKLPGDRRDGLLRSLAHTVERIWTGAEPADYFRRIGTRKAVALEHIAAMPVVDLQRIVAELKAPPKKLIGYARHVQARLNEHGPAILKAAESALAKWTASAPAATVAAPVPRPTPAPASKPATASRGGWSCGEGDYVKAKQAARERLGAKASESAVRTLAGELLAKSL